MNALLWAAALLAAGYNLWHARHWLDEPDGAAPERRRADGNGGHAQVDFGGQWVMGRMVVLGHGRELYHRPRQWQVVRAGFPASDESPLARGEATASPDPAVTGRDAARSHDADNLMYWFMGADPPAWKTVGGAAVAPLGADPLAAAARALAAADAVTPAVVDEVTRPAVGGPLYPPVHALLYAPLGLIDRPRTAYRVMQVVGLAAVFVAGLGVKVLSRGRVPWSAATLLLLVFPGTRSGLDLGQNPTVSLAILVWGWALAARGRDIAGGAVWGLFAFKPVWGLAFAVVPLLTGRWRFAAAMALTGAGLAAATLPVVGVQAWFDWLEVGKEASALYNVNRNWILLSRDLQGIPRRILHDFNLPEADRDTRLARGLAWGLWAAVLGATAAVYLWKADRRRPTGVGAGFLFLGAFLTCYRFMYYDVLLAAAGCAVLFADPRPFFRTRVLGLTFARAAPLEPGVPAAPPDPAGPRWVGYVSSFPLTVLALLVVYETAVSGWEIRGTVAFGHLVRVTTGPDGATGTRAAMLEVDTGLHYPWDTGLVLALWAWCGWRLLRGEERRQAV
ncbi:MAG: hypothetical protein C0501_03950 [Isosphaera sp.]|nr:hypothetical protein [Isosphaera sp.]